MKFTICIPNYNYARYLGTTIHSVLAQEYDNLNVIVSDNASTDGSVEVARSFDDPRVSVHVNPRNLGFSANLDAAAGRAGGDRLILLSSDDLMGPDALFTYHRFLQLLPQQGARSLLGSAQYEIDSDGKITDHQKLLKPPILLPSDRVPELEQAMGASVYRVPAQEMLRRCLLRVQNPFYFATSCYPRQLYEEVGGYGGGRTYNPDKWFHWRLMSVADNVYYIDRPLFSYRWHNTNQAAQEKKGGTLKFLVDDYLSTLELPNQVLAAVSLSRDDLEQAYMEIDIGRHGWAVLAKENASQARRILNFGCAVYPHQAWRNRKVVLLKLAVPWGPLAHHAAKWLYRLNAQRNARREAALAASQSAPLVAGSPNS